MNEPRVHLMSLSIRTRAKGTPYLSGFLGRAKVVAFKGRTPDKFGCDVWDVDVTQAKQRQERPRLEPEVSGLADSVV